uniref:Myeloblastosis oncogene n=1 Tax=Nothobranchius pienaari TaxID=704102 RepID=A0A1A8LI29_9TELE
MSSCMEEGDVDLSVAPDSIVAGKKDDKDAECDVKWTQEEDENLKILINNFGRKDWRTIASFLPGRTELQCMNRWNKYLGPELAKGSWTKEEDDKLTEMVAKHGTKNWGAVAKHVNGKVGKQCRDRWYNHLDPFIKKTTWSEEEDLIIYKASCILGNRWTEIARLLPGRSDFAVRNRYNYVIKRKGEMDMFKEDFDKVSLDIENYMDGEADFKCDVVIDANPVSPEVDVFQVTAQKVKQEKGREKAKQKTAAQTRQNSASRKEESPPSSCLPPSSSSSSNSVAASGAPLVDQKRFAEAALKMIAEDMLPLSFVEGTGFRCFMNTINPKYNKLSQRAIGLLLYEEVERSIKPQLIRDLKQSLTKTKDGGSIIHVTCDLWAGDQSKQVDDPVLVTQLHFINDSWQIRRPIVAFRHLNRKNLNDSVAKGVEGVLLSYGLFSHSIGYVLTNQAKELLSGNNIFCDYKIVCSPNRGETDGDEISAFLSDQMCEEGSPFSSLQIGTRSICVTRELQIVIRDALKNSRVVENLLSQVHNVVAFFRSSAFWGEALLKESNVSLCPSSSNCRWNSMMLSLRRMVREPTWSHVMTLLAQARIEATDLASAPPLVMVKREQVVDILGLLEPFEEALQALQGNGVTISLIIPCLIGLDKNLENRVTNYTHFSKALRTGLHTHFQSLMYETDIVLATVLDPRLKLQPFPPTKPEVDSEFLKPPSKSEVYNIITGTLGARKSPGSTPDKEESELVTQNTREEPTEMEAAGGNCDEAHRNNLKRKSIFSSSQSPAKMVKTSEIDQYLSEPVWECGSSLTYWKFGSRFPQLQDTAKKLLVAPASSGGFDRLYPMATCIVRAKRNRVPPHTTERLLLYKNSAKTSTVKKIVVVPTQPKVKQQ